MAEPCLTCNEEYEAMVAAQARRRLKVRAWQAAQLNPTRAKDDEVHNTLALPLDSTLNRNVEFQYFEVAAANRRDLEAIEETVPEEELPVLTLPDEPEEIESFKPEPVKPASNAPRREWVQYVLALGNPESVLKGKTQADLVKEYGS